MAQNLPSLCLSKIFEFHSDDLFTLHSCALVNRDWCRFAIPLLWKRPFIFLHQYTPETLSIRLMDVYCAGLSNKERNYINKLLGNLEEKTPSNSLFNYVTFLRELDVLQASFCITRWAYFTHVDYMIQTLPFINIFLQHFVNNSPKITHLKFTINNIYGSAGWHDINLNLLISKNAKDCFEQLKVLDCAGDFNPKLLFLCSMLSKRIEKIRISIYNHFNQPSNEINKLQNLCYLIQSQQRLKILIIENVKSGCLGEQGVLGILEFTDGIHRSLEQLIFRGVDFYNYNIILSISNLRKLNTLKFEKCNLSNHPLNFGNWGNMRGLSNLTNLSVFGSKIPFTLLTFMIFQTKFGLTVLDTRTNEIKAHEVNNLLQIISQNCKHLVEFLTLLTPNHDHLPLLLPILTSNTKLEKLVIDTGTFGGVNIASHSENVDTFLPILGKHLPPSLRDLNIIMVWSFHHESLDKFFQESRATLEILQLQSCYCIKDEHIDVILKHSKDHLKFLNIQGTTNITHDTWNKLQQNDQLVVEFHQDVGINPY
ncbi:631_t:CDS:2 [Funneliformis geosporum]|uniref:19051_t:CDS:1 n=1 Tax=Funneliformis geosporum TaxID=1117311 RepID=A0A9W4WNC8_9GLOM|nr:631_t:CDS:2 [Funneliformis geosporum]CAI2174758.1 19051_t:CDS:2 [Funneliformis geosporum]